MNTVNSTRSSSTEPVINSHFINNPRGYLLFDINLIPIYSNNQLRYYHILEATLKVD